MTVSVGFTTESQNAIDKLDGVVKSLVDGASDRAQKVIANRVAKTIRDDLYYEMVKLAPRSPNTRSSDPRILLDTKKYVRSFQARKYKKGWGIYALKDKFRYAHDGASNRPRRPHVTLTLNRNRKKLSRMAMNELRKDWKL